jgi:hypothetical protein
VLWREWLWLSQILEAAVDSCLRDRRRRGRCDASASQGPNLSFDKDGRSRAHTFFHLGTAATSSLSMAMWKTSRVEPVSITRSTLVYAHAPYMQSLSFCVPKHLVYKMQGYSRCKREGVYKNTNAEVESLKTLKPRRVVECYMIMTPAMLFVWSDETNSVVEQVMRLCAAGARRPRACDALLARPGLC